MKRLALMMALALGAAGPVVAMEGTAQWYVVSSNPQGVSTMDIGRLQRRGDVAVSMSAIYFVKPQTSAEGEVVDFVQTLDSYDCSKRGFSRNIMGEGYRVGQQPPVFAYGEENGRAPWKQFEEGSSGMSSWKAACEGVEDRYLIRNANTHEDLLFRLRSGEEAGR